MTPINTEHEKPSTNPDVEIEQQNERDLGWIAKRRNRLNVATQETRFKILQKITGHPYQLPTLKELNYFMTGVSKSTIRNHLETLISAGIVARVELPEDDRTRDNPHVFYGLTEEGRQDLEDVSLLETEHIAQEATLRTEITPDVKQYMDAPRPEWEPANTYDQ